MRVERGLDRQKRKNLGDEHSRNPHQDDNPSPHGPGSTVCPAATRAWILILARGGRGTGPGSGQPAALAGEIYDLAEPGREGACKHPGSEKEPSVSWRSLSANGRGIHLALLGRTFVTLEPGPS